MLVPACRSMDLSASQFFHGPTLLGYNAGRLKRVHRTGESVQFVTPRYRTGNGQGLPCPKFRPTTWTVYLKGILRSNSQRHISTGDILNTRMCYIQSVRYRYRQWVGSQNFSYLCESCLRWTPMDRIRSAPPPLVNKHNTDEG